MFVLCLQELYDEAIDPEVGEVIEVKRKEAMGFRYKAARVTKVRFDRILREPMVDVEFLSEGEADEDLVCEAAQIEAVESATVAEAARIEAEAAENSADLIEEKMIAAWEAADAAEEVAKEESKRASVGGNADQGKIEFDLDSDDLREIARKENILRDSRLEMRRTEVMAVRKVAIEVRAKANRLKVAALEAETEEKELRNRIENRRKRRSMRAAAASAVADLNEGREVELRVPLARTRRRLNKNLARFDKRNTTNEAELLDHVRRKGTLAAVALGIKRQKEKELTEALEAARCERLMLHMWA